MYLTLTDNSAELHNILSDQGVVKCILQVVVRMCDLLTSF